MRFLLTTIAVFSFFSTLQAQLKPYRVDFLEGSYNKVVELTGEIDSTSYQLKILGIRNELFASGHLLSNVDSISRGDTLQAVIHVGPKYRWHSLGVNNIPEEYLSKAGYREKDFEDRQTDFRQFNRLVNRLLRQATNAGYPFASFQFDEVKVNANYLQGVLSYSPGPVVRYDSLTINPPDLINAKYMAAYLHVREGELFNYSDIANIDATLDKLPYLQLTDPLQLAFANNLCNISLSMQKVKSNRFDAIIGFLPNQGANNGLRVTGYADLHLDNLFRAGKSLTFQWQQFQAQSQKLYLNYKHPNLLRSPLGLEVEADLIRQDSSFLNTDLAFDIFYTRKKTEVALLSNFVSSRQLSNPVDTTTIPEVADYNMRLFGVDYTYDNLSKKRAARSGYALSISARFGNRNIRKNPALSEAVYDSIKLKSNQLQLNLESDFNQRLGKLLELGVNIQGGLVRNNDRLFVNDLLRLGGVNSLRGFNELDLYVSSYGLTRLELRLLMSEASRIFLFYDQALTYNKISNLKESPLGFGAGIYLATAAGDLQLVYALGVSQEQSLSLDQSKIHLGYVAKF